MKSEATDKPANQKGADKPLDPTQDVTITGTGKNKHLKKGVEYPVSGADAQAMIEAGHATLSDNSKTKDK